MRAGTALSIFDYVVVSGSLEYRVTEYVDHLHEHFIDPFIVVDGHYVLPERPGYSARMVERSVADFTYPDGAYWRSRSVAPAARVSLG